MYLLTPSKGTILGIIQFFSIFLMCSCK